MVGWDDNTTLLVALVLAVFAGAGFLMAIRPIRRLLRSDPRPDRSDDPPREKRPIPLPRVAEERRPASPGQLTPFKLVKFWVVDGDTIQDNRTGTVYRLANIDCPETDAKCYRERKLGERAKFEAYRLLKSARVITVRPTGKVDTYGRSVAAIDLDGHDYGQLLIDRGFALPWRGMREDWCGPNGGLVRVHEACSAKLHCKTCGARAGVADSTSEVKFPVVYREPPAVSARSLDDPPQAPK